MKNVLSKVAAAWSKVPSLAKTEAAHVVLTFAVAFASVAAPALPALVKQVEGGQLPDLSTVHALVVAAVAAGLKAAIPAARTAVLTLVRGLLKYVRAKKTNKLEAALAAYILTHRAEIEEMLRNPQYPGTP